ncbi:hypothetical protein CP336_00670 [Pseudomonas fluorescens]|nr:hypothetical protein CP336_00670 [Pseudomonas fluorescens]
MRGFLVDQYFRWNEEIYITPKAIFTPFISLENQIPIFSTDYVFYLTIICNYFEMYSVSLSIYTSCLANSVHPIDRRIYDWID